MHCTKQEYLAGFAEQLASVWAQAISPHEDT